MFVNVQDIAGDDAVSPVATILAPPAIKVARPIGQTANSAYSIVVAEIFAGFGAWRVWTLLGWDDIRQRYRRSVLGPFWITLSMGMFILLLGVIYGRLFHMELATYLPYLAVGIIVWGFMSAAINESCSAFHESGRIIKQIKLPYSVFILRVVWRNFIVFLHNIVIFLPVAIIFHVVPNLNTLYALPGFVLVFANVTWLALLLAIVSTRYRDIMPIVATVVQILMFATPIMWVVSSLSGAEIIAEVNPAYHLIELVRAPMLGAAPEPLSWLVSIAMALAGSALATALLVRKSRRIVFWL
jgi:ABC-type polysaccharide/polyol phosphate export permease